jgi:hypothetical protein
MSDKLKRAWDKAVKGADQRLWVYGTLGDSNGTIAVPGRADYVYVTLGNKSVTWARNEAGVPLTAGLAVRMRVEHGTHVIYGRYTSGDIAAPTPTPPSGVLAHDFIDHSDVPASYTGEAGNVVAVNATEDGLEFIAAPGGAVDSVNGQTGAVVLDSDDIAEGTTNKWFTAAEETKLAGIEALADVTDAGNIATAINGATEKTTPVNADKWPLINSVGNVLAWVSGTNLKAFLKTYFDTLYVALTGDQTIAGNKTLTGNTRLGSSGAASNVVHVRKDQNANTAIIVENATNGASAQAAFQAINSAGSNFSFAIYPPARSYGAIAGGDGFMYGTSNVVIMCDNASGVIKFAAGGQNERARIDASGNVGLGVVAPQGIFHAHDGTTGWLKVSKTGVAGTAVTLIPDGTGDCLYRMDGRYVVRASDGTVLSGSFNANNGGSAILYNASGHTLTLGINANGSVYVQRTAGSLTFTVALDMMWI